MMTHKNKGFTLIELLIVIFIISIVSTVALLTIGHNQNRRMESLANQFTQMISLAEEQAILRPAVLGVVINSSSFEFVSYQPTDDGKGMHWVSLDDSGLRRHTIPDNIVVTLSTGDTSATTENKEGLTPQIVISTNGDVTPFTLSIGQSSDAPRYIVRGDADGTVTSQEQE